ncbi:nitroreductase [Ophiostoma piceae UAMH 11346]|uniref:Nitroreductase n=1 Tax=Ophiostoma piceae (strain UAMH 11346) TaxID=1262450 RepID=S3D7V7_OPHP1|nr:nitroreductase [Ophiostoma piceae UAMH 11346]
MSDIKPLVAARYGTESTADVAHITVNHTLETLLSHKSVRHFVADQPLVPKGSIDVLVAAAQSAPTSSNLQAWSVVAVQDKDRKDKLATLSGDQQFIRDAPLFLVFTADLHRSDVVSAKESTPGDALAYTELFLVGALDAAFAAQNTVVAAEALGLGVCYVGAARNKPREVAALLGLPPRVIALFGLAVGIPDKTAAAVSAPVKPRLPGAEVLHLETWDDSDQKTHLETYNKALGEFNSSQRADQPAWTNRAAARVATKESLHGRHELLEVLKERNLARL